MSESARMKAPHSCRAAGRCSPSRAVTTMSRRYSDGVNNNMRIAREEIFGPVMSVIGFKTADEAVPRSPTIRSMDWQGAVWSNNINVAHKVARPRCVSARMGINNYFGGDMTVPVRRLQTERQRAGQVHPRVSRLHRAEDHLDRIRLTRVACSGGCGHLRASLEIHVRLGIPGSNCRNANAVDDHGGFDESRAVASNGRIADYSLQAR